jgi:hypothetical protein
MFRWEDHLDLASREAVSRSALNYSNERSRPTFVDPLVTERISYINNRAPWLAPKTQVALAKSYASDIAVDKIAGLASRELINNPQQSYTNLIAPPKNYWVTPAAVQARINVGQGKKDQDVGFLDNIYGGLKQTSRVATAIGMGAIELLNNSAALEFEALGPLNSVINPFYTFGREAEGKNQNIKTALNSLSLWQLLTDWENQGEGFFISEDQMSRQAEAAREFRGTINGSAFTIGRGAAATTGLDGDKWYNNISGFIDFGIALAIPDPNKYIVKGAKGITAGVKAAQVASKGGDFVDAFTAAKGIVPLVSQVDANAFAKALKEEAGITKTLEGSSIDVVKWNNFMDNNRVAVSAVKSIVKTTRPEEILERFKGRITLEDAEAFAKAKNADEVKQVMIKQYAIGPRTLSTSIYDINPTITSRPGAFIVQRTPLKRSRLLMHLPERDIVINGDDQQRSASVLNMIKSIRNAGGNDEDVRKFSESAFKNFGAKSSADDQRDAYKVYESAVRVILERNGVVKEVSDLVFERPRYDMQKLRKYMSDRMGVETDNGMMKVYAAQLRKHFPDTVYNDMLEKIAETGYEGFGFTRPMQLSELFDRVQTLPDVRELRRLTSNPLIAEAMSKVGVDFKPTKVLTTKLRKIEVTEYLDEERAVQIKQDLKDLYGKTRSNENNVKIGQLKDELDSITTKTERRKYTGEANMGIAFLDTLQNSIWKPLQLATVGYAVRNSIDAQIRMAFGGASGFLNHPGEYITLLIGETKSANKLMKMAKKAGLDTMEKSILGETLTASSKNIVGDLRRDHAELLGLDLRKQGLGASTAGTHLHRTNNWISVSKFDNENYTRGVITQIRLAHEDDLRRVVARGRILGMDDEEIMQELLSTAKQRKNFDNIDGIYRRGVPFKDIQGKEVFGPPVTLRGLDKDALDDWLRNVHLKPVVVDDVDNLAGGLQEMHFMMAFDRVPEFDKVFTKQIDDLIPKFPNEDLKAGSFIKNSDGTEGVITRLADNGEATVVPVLAGSASKGFAGHRMAQRFVRNSPVTSGVAGDIGLPQRVEMEVIHAGRKDRDQWLGDVQDKMDQYTNLLFNEMYGQKWVKTTERSPVFRKFYYETVLEQIGRLSKEEAEGLIAKLKLNAEKAGFGDDIGKYIGNSEAAERLMNVTGTGNVTAAQLDDYARIAAIEKTKGLLYDASEKNNLEDILRIVTPFVSAWREVLGTYVGLMIEDPTVATRFGRFAGQLMNSDPDKDGRGFWYRDPQTDQMYFKFPAIPGMPSWALDKMTGVSAFFEAPVSQLSQGLSWVPGLGPIAQIPASFLLKDKPDTSKIVQVLMPYGKVSKAETLTSLNPLPPVVTKLGGVLTSYFTNTEDQMSSAFAGTYIDVLRARYATGEYDINTEDGLKKLKSDTKRDAQNITILRAAQQFLGPTSPQVGLKVKAQGIDVYVDQMAKVFEKMQEENYDTAVQRFLSVFGNEMALYVGSKTQSQIPGLEASREFGEWEFENGDLLQGEFKEVAAYFAPAGSELNFDVWKRQLGQGKRVKLTDDELIKSAQNRIGSSKYRAARKMFGSFPNDAQRAKLDAYRASLNEQYPGFPRFAQFEVGKFPNQIDKLGKLVEDPRVQDNELTPLIREYLATRKIYLAQAGGKSFESKKATPSRMFMYNYGNRLAQQNPQFDRIWQRLLIQEVED